MKKNITIVTGLWDLGRGNIEGWGKRDFQQYIEKFKELLQTDAQMCVWIPKFLEEEVKKIRKNLPTKIYIKENEDFKSWFPFWDKLQEIRTNPNWYNFAGWLAESPQAALEFYNPMMMTKMFMVNDSAIHNPFNSDYFYWIDGGITSTVSSGYFLNDNVLDNLDNYSDSIEDKFLFITYPYDQNEEIHGFERKKMAEYCGVERVINISRGGFWGGKKELIHNINSKYYGILEKTIKEGYMGADECLFTIISHKHKDEVYNFSVDSNGLVWPFFEKLKEYKDYKRKYKNNDLAIYILTYNSPKQLKKLMESFENSDPAILGAKTKIILNNSNKEEFFQEYDEICDKYKFKEIHYENIGICGGRQKVAELFEEDDAEFYIFFEDDMFIDQKEELCPFGFRTKINNFIEKSIKIIKKENLDFLKLSFSEFYGNNSQQWAWYNIPGEIRKKYFPENKEVPTPVDYKKTPKTLFHTISQEEGLPYAVGEVYYSNWPVLFCKRGNKKVFIETKWKHPYEQTWMSHVFQKQKENYIKSGVLLASLINHNRFEFYSGKERKEN